jgi:dUTP pyrophosphatase
MASTRPSANLSEQSTITEWLLNTYGKYMHVTLYVDSEDAEFIQKYRDHVNAHNGGLFKDISYVNAGFDLLAPRNVTCVPTQTNKVSMEVKCAASVVQTENRYFNTGYYMYPRSSISKTPLRLANSVGIIDAGYRGQLIGMFDMLPRVGVEEYHIAKYDRLLQICSPDLSPIYVKLTDDLSELGVTSRGEGGFGSTGK